MTQRDPEALRAKLLADPNTERIAKTLNVSVEEYIDTVLTYAVNPGLEPEFATISDENLVKMGAPKPPSIKEMVDWVEEAVEVSAVHERTDYEDSKVGPVDLGKAPPVEARPDEVRPELKELADKMRRKGGKV